MKISKAPAVTSSSTVAAMTTPSTTLEGHTFDYRRVIVDYGWLFSRADVHITRGLLMSAEASTMLVEVAEELTLRGATLGETRFFTDDLGLTSAADMVGVIEERGGPVPILVIATDANGAMHVYELEDGGRRFAPGT